MTDAVCDYLVIGGGAAGCIVAARLAELTNAHVLLVEAGRTDEGDPAATRLSLLETQDKSYDWGYVANTVTGATGAIDYARAKMLGGCANHNDCAFIAPAESDLRSWVALGAKGWGLEDVRPASSRIEQAIHIELSPPGNRLSRAFIDAGIELGLPERNFRGKLAAGTGWFPLNAKGDFRQSSSVAYLHPLSNLPCNLQVRTNITVLKLLLEGRRIIGAETDCGRIACRREAILCAGSINTPQILMLSGLGPASELRQLGIKIAADIPGVGQNLVDHVAANIAFALKQPSPAWERTPCEATLLLQVDKDAPAPDVLFHFVLRLREKYAGQKRFAGIEHGVKLSPNVARPKSRGSVRLASSDPHAKPIINLNCFSDPEGYDRRILLSGLRFARKLAATRALSPWLGEEVAPGAGISDDEALFDYVKAACETVYHPAGTCRMGAASDPVSVVDPNLRMKGIEDLRVADASVFPGMVTPNIGNTVMMVAEHGAELIAKDWHARSG